MKSAKPGFLNSLSFSEDTSQFIYKNFHYGRFFKLNIPFINLYIVTDPEVAHHILIHNDNNYVKSRIYWGELRKIIGKSIGTTEEETWLLYKKIHNQGMNPMEVKKHFKVVSWYVAEHLKIWEEERNIQDISEHFGCLNISIVMDVLFGSKDTDRQQEIAAHIADGEAIIAYRSKSPLHPILTSMNGMNQTAKSYLKFFDELSKKAISENRNNPELYKLIDYLIAASPIKGADSISEETIRNEMIVYLGASTETTGIAEAWITYLLWENPEVLKKMRREIDSLHALHINETHIDKLIYTSWVIKEAMRLYPPSHALIRDAVSEDKIGDINIQPDDVFYISTFGIHRNPENWKDPDKFIPERFEQEDNFPPFHYVPFGAGKHTCIGRFLVMPMMMITMAEFVRRFDFELTLQKPLEPVSISTLKPNQPLKIKLTPRNQN